MNGVGPADEKALAVLMLLFVGLGLFMAYRWTERKPLLPGKLAPSS